jgi:Pg-II fimbriae c
MKKQFFVAAMALVLGAGFTACSSDDLNVKPGTEVNQKATTYMSVSFVLPTANSTRAAADGQDDADPKFNNVGKWAGKDKIEKVNVYVFNAAGTLEAAPSYNAAQLSFAQVSTGSAAAKVTPNSAFKVTPGQKTVYVVVNPTTAAETLLNATVNTTTLAAFKAAYESSNLAFAKASTRTADYTTGDETNAGEIAKVDNDQDIILMTGKAEEPTIADNVSAAEAVSGVKNRTDLTVQRAVARVLVSTTATSFNVKGVNPTTGAIENDAVVVSDLTYVVGQGENKLYFLQKDNGGTDGAAFTTPAFAQVPSNDDYWTTDFQTSYNTVGAHYDYSGLWKNTAGTTAKVKGITVPNRTAFNSSATTELGNVTTDLNTALKGEFVLPTLHKYNTDRAQSGYRKGNTAYILVRGYLTPKYYVAADGTVTDNATTPLAANADVYVGANGVFYADNTCVQDPAKKGVAGQTAQLYKGRKVMYFVWINPDDVDGKAVNSPVIRNNIYHVQIKGIAKIGANWNPLVPNPNVPTTPGQPVDPNDPHNPINNNPNNPDPRPDNPLEPKDPPVDPKDPITSKETWMSVNVNILPWAVHSYEVELSI